MYQKRIQFLNSERTLRLAASWAFADAREFPEVKLEGDEAVLIWKEAPSDELVNRFLKALNDYVLREQIDVKTLGLREKIVGRALKRIYESEPGQN